MCRLFTVGLALALFMPSAWGVDDVKDKKTGEMDLKVEGKLTKDDPKDKVQKDSPHKVHEYKMKAGGIYVIDMKRQDPKGSKFDPVLRLENSAGKELAENDDDPTTPRTLDSKIVFKAPKDDAYRIIATCLEGIPGSYTLTVRKGTEEELVTYVKLADPFHDLIGKPAPDITSEFSFNGETKKLSDLKGKVVLLDFWAVWCGPCIQTFPHLRDWDKDFKGKGLAVLGVTTYFQTLKFDKSAGRPVRAVKKVKDDKTGDVKEEPIKLSPAEEHDMLKDFAGYHKLTHRLMAISNEGWKKAGQDYSIRGIPHAVLIDRKGMIRMVRVGSGPANAAAIDTEIKKLIAEK